LSFEERFEVVRAVHIGQIAAAYEAVQKQLDRKVLLKVIHAQWARDEELIERFAREGKAAARINHPNVVRIFESGREEGLPYLALEWIEGQSLAERLKGGPLSQNEVLRLARELLDGLGAVHDAGLLHRDIKPDNIMLGQDSSAHLTDFSLAGLTGPSRLTGHQSLVGSPAYIAPELISGAPASAQSDLYAVGVVLYEALTGSNPFEMDDPIATLDRVRQGGAPKLAGRGRIDASLANLVDSLIAADPQARPNGAAAALIMLKGEPVSIPVVEVIPAHPVWRWFSIWKSVAAFGAIIIAAVILWTLRPYNPAVQSPPEVVRQDSLLSVAQNVEPVSSAAVDSAATNPTVPLETRQRASPTPAALETISAPAQRQSDSLLVHNADEPETEASVVIMASPWGNIEIDGRPMGTSPLGAVKLKPGVHRLRVTHPSFPAYVGEITVGAKDTIRVDLPAASSAAFVSALPWGYLWVDGDSIGLLPRDGPLWLAPGGHLLGIFHPDFGWWSDSIRFEAGNQLKIKVNLQNGTMVATPIIGSSRE